MDSKTYWSRREAAQLRKNTKDELEYNKKIQDTYNYMLDNIQKEINGFYARYAKAEGITLSEAKKKVSKLDIEAYGRKAERYVKDKTFTKEANEEMRLYNATMKINRLEMLKANIGLELVSGFDEMQKYFDTILTDRTMAEFKRQAGILGKSVLNNEKAAQALVNASFQNATYSERIWMYQDMLKSELAKELKTGLIQGRNPRVLARHISKLFGVSRNNAETLMQTELARVQTEAQKQSYDRNGYDQYIYIAEPTACPVCRVLDDKVFDVKKMMPGENAAPMHPHCRCSTAAYMDREEFDKWLDHIDKGGTTEGWEHQKNKKPVKIEATSKIIAESEGSQDDAQIQGARKVYGKTDGAIYDSVLTGDSVNRFERVLNKKTDNYETIKTKELTVPKNTSGSRPGIYDIGSMWSKNAIMSGGRIAINDARDMVVAREKVKSIIQNEVDILGGIREDGVFYRVTGNKKEIGYVRDGTIKPSVNHMTEETESGLSVWESPKYADKIMYRVKGDVIDIGADGEPILDVKTIKLLPDLKSSTTELREKGKKMFLKKYDWTEEQLENALMGRVNRL